MLLPRTQGNATRDEVALAEEGSRGARLLTRRLILGDFILGTTNAIPESAVSRPNANALELNTKLMPRNEAMKR
jgi:hypothetical protein